MRKKLADNDERFPAHIRQLLAEVPCDDDCREYLLEISSQFHAEMQQIQAELLALAEKQMP